MTNRLNAFVFDVDGTLADHTERFQHLKETPKNWKDYKAKVHLDKPIMPIIRILKALEDAGYYTILLTGRSEEQRVETEKWFHAHEIYYSFMLMRSTGDFRPDMEVKKELYLKYIDPDYYVHAIFEDRSRMVETWRAMGINTLQVADGDY